VLVVVLVLAVAFCGLCLQHVWTVFLPQRIISSGTLIVYAFAVGGVFATRIWYEAFHGTFAVVVATRGGDRAGLFSTLLRSKPAFLALYVPPSTAPDCAQGDWGCVSPCWCLSC